MKQKSNIFHPTTMLPVLAVFLCAGWASALSFAGPPSMIRIVISEAARDSDLKINDRPFTTDEFKHIAERVAAISTEQLVMLSVQEQAPAYRLMEVINILYDVGLRRVVLVPLGRRSIPARQVDMVEHFIEFVYPVELDPVTGEVIPAPEPKPMADVEADAASIDPAVKVITVAIPGRERMANSVMVYAYLATWVVYLVLIYAWFRHAGFHRLTLISVSHAVPSVIALAMAYIFLVRGGTTNIQAVVGLDSEIHLWSLWSHLWPIFRSAAVISGGVNLGWLLAACVRKSWRKWIPIALTAAGLAVFAFVAVSANYPVE